MASIKYRVAKAVIAGEFGNDEERIRRLRDAGHDPDEIQRIVNDIILHGYVEPENIMSVTVDLSQYDGLEITLI